ncbi:hypothetical protein AB0I72_28095 [Nocardiopsis sp. NPDC049922]|uniref:hypothetical protein n=1 Tax=Nocardiopsis sp. NPDC049922 TaxID=3155157 RepID=UPI0033ECFAB7
MVTSIADFGNIDWHVSCVKCAVAWPRSPETAFTSDLTANASEAALLRRPCNKRIEVTALPSANQETPPVGSLIG